MKQGPEIQQRQIKKVFIANRAEIVCRIVRTAKKLGMSTCGVFTLQDSRTKHVRDLDEAFQLPPGELSENYLNPELMIRVAKDFKADAIHPGYGFLAESADFAEMVLRAGLIWVGPNPAAMRKLGGKITAKEIARSAEVPVPSWTKVGKSPDQKKIDQILSQIGFPLLIKAAHGGGGRGQRVVRKASEFQESFRAAQSESLRSFGSAEVFIEKFLEKPRHIEVQIMADEHGNIYALGERDCTIQRRNQKLIEECPAVIIDQRTRANMISSAISLAKAAGYTNAGTVEFLVEKTTSGWEFFFMEMNARLQVEHPITEFIWGVDMVELQFRAAQGENLHPILEPVAPKSNAHAMELRLCAEDPENHFLPSPGPITEFKLPHRDNLRVDTGFETGDVVAQEYDSLFAKMIVCTDSRKNTITELSRILKETTIAGLLTNKYFLDRVLNHAEFEQNSIFTRWIETHPELTSASDQLDSDLEYWGRKMSSELLVQRNKPQVALPPLQNQPACKVLLDFLPDEEEHGSISPQGLVKVSGDFVLADEAKVHASGWISRFELCLSFSREVNGLGQRRIGFAGQYDVDDQKAHHGPITAHVPGVVLEVRARVNEIVKAQEPILVIEAMKIEMPMSLPIAARITEIRVKQGDRIQPGQTLVTWEPEA